MPKKGKLFTKYKEMPVQIKASLWFMICSFFQRGIMMITTPIFTRLLSTADYGNLDAFNSWMSIISVIVTLNLFGGVYQRGLIAFEDERKVFSSSIQGLTFTLCSFWTVIYLLFAEFWNSLFKLTTVQMLLMIIMIWSSVVFNLWATEQRADYKYKGIVLVTVISTVLNPALGIALVLGFEDKVLAKILSMAVTYVMCYAWMFIWQMLRGKTFFSKRYWIHALKFNIPLVPHYLSQVVLNGADRIMIKNMVGPSEAGIYGIAYALSQVMIMFNSALMDTLNPWIYKKIRDKQIDEIAPVAYGSLVFIAAVNIALIAFAPEAIAIFAPEDYYPAKWCVPPIAMSVYFLFSYDLFAKFEFYFEKTKLIAVTTMAGALINIITNYIFIKLTGYQAAAYTTLLCYMLYSIFHYAAMTYVCKHYLEGIRPYDIRILFAITGGFLLIGFLYLISYGNSLIRYSITVILIIVMFIFRKKIKEVADKFFEIRNQNKEKKEEASK